MKKVVIVLLILLVLGITGYFVYTEISVKEITYVSDVETNENDGRYSVRRLYSSDIDIEKLNEKVESLTLLEFSEEDILAAALEAGTPEFYPAFHILTYRPSVKDRYIRQLCRKLLKELPDSAFKIFRRHLGLPLRL